jgi:hypothetical protein
MAYSVECGKVAQWPPTSGVWDVDPCCATNDGTIWGIGCTGEKEEEKKESDS